MKKFIALLISLVLVFCLAACSGEQPTDNNSSDANNSDNKVLVVYFSQPETTTADNMTEQQENSVVVIDGEVLGNTQYVAYVIQENTGADIFRIVPETPYTTNHMDLTNIAKQEQTNNARPNILGSIENFEKYETVFVGYPIWWGDMPMILYSFFDDYDLSGKTVIPFSTHGGSGLADTISAITSLEPNAKVDQTGYTVSRDDVQNAEPEILEWLKGLGY